jgi:hypothetical protein
MDVVDLIRGKRPPEGVVVGMYEADNHAQNSSAKREELRTPGFRTVAHSAGPRA